MSLGIIRSLGTILFVYLIWRNLRENYKENDLISYSWMALISFLLGGRLLFGLINWGVWNNSWIDWVSLWSKPGMSYLGAYLFVFGATWLIAKSRDWKIWSFMEDSLVIFLIFFEFLMLDEFVRSSFNLIPGIYSLIILITLIISIFIKNKYRSFVWYKSGKKGFTFFFSNFLLCLMLTIMSFWLKFNLIYSFLYLIGSLIYLVGLFILGEVFQPLFVNSKRKNYEK
jgi:hypothetical protein